MRMRPVALGIGCLWALLALLCWIVPAPVARGLLALLSGSILVAACAWYGMARRARGVNASQLRKPIALCAAAWACCLGSALVAAYPLGNGTSRTSSSTLADSKIFDNGPFKFLCDLPAFDQQPGPWPIGKNGLIGDGGKVIVVNGHVSPKSLGMRPPDNSEAAIKFRLYREAARFKTMASLDDTAGRPASAAFFQVLGDGKPLWKSDPISQRGDSQECDVDVTGVDVLELRVRATGSSNEVHAVWVDPRLLRTSGTADSPPPFVLFSHGPREFLSDMPEFDVKQGPWPFAKNGDFGGQGGKMKVEGIPSPHGLGIHAPTTGYAGVKYHLYKQAAIFKAKTALNDGCSFTIGSCHFEVVSNGRVLWKSKTISKEKQVEECNVDVTNVDVLELRVVNPDIVNHGIQAVWFEPRVLQTADAPDD